MEVSNVAAAKWSGNSLHLRPWVGEFFGTWMRGSVKQYRQERVMILAISPDRSYLRLQLE